MTEVQVQVTESSTALKEATTVITDTRRRYQALDIDLQSAINLVRTCVQHSIISATFSALPAVSDLSFHQYTMSIFSTASTNCIIKLFLHLLTESITGGHPA